MREARISQGELHGAASYDISMPMTGEREFRVTGRLSDDAPDTVNLRLRIQQQDGEPLHLPALLSSAMSLGYA